MTEQAPLSFCGSAMKGDPRKRLFAFLGLFLLPAASALAQQVGSVVGELHVTRSDFPGRVLVELQLHSSPIASQYTDEQGKFVFGSLTNNLYHVVIRDERFFPIDQIAILDLSITSCTMVQIQLMPREKNQTSG